jgi:succinate dehydrogenase/fumarate reductase flavoprotein subunit
MCDLLISQGQVAGAVGVHTRSGEIFAFQAKAVVLATGRSNRLSRNLCGFDFNTRMAAPLSGDGTSMAMRAGLPIVSSEFLSNILGLGPCGNYNPNYGDPRNTVQPAARIVDGRGNEVVPRTRFYDWSTLGKEKWSPEVRQRWLADRKVWRGGRASMVARTAAGEGPFYLDFGQATDDEIAYIEWSIGNEGRGTQFLRYFKGEEGADLRRNPQEYVGRWPREISGTAAKGLWVDRDLETELHNLFGAGDEVGGLPWQAGPGAITQGWHAGAQAAKRAALMTAVPAGDEEPVRERREMCREMRSRRVGFHWREVETGVQNLMDFYCGDVRSEGLLRRGLERLEDAKAAPLKAENPHELARCLDLKSIIDNAELVLRSSLERTESRPTPFGFRRADYPDQNDAEWLAFLAVRKGSDGEFRFARLPVDR